ncbi:MAG: hypothetical protein LBL15_06305 [Oscillospiraceae bacterium]|nr:hypothetical protein [Oscillospiraceae bacterium]
MDLVKAAFDYSVRVAELVKHLRSDEKGFPLSDDLLECGVNAGMFLRDPPSPDKDKALACLNKADYLLDMAATAGYLTERQTARIRENGQELIKMINESGGIQV